MTTLVLPQFFFRPMTLGEARLLVIDGSMGSYQLAIFGLTIAFEQKAIEIPEQYRDWPPEELTPRYLAVRVAGDIQYEEWLKQQQ